MKWAICPAVVYAFQHHLVSQEILVKNMPVGVYWMETTWIPAYYGRKDKNSILILTIPYEMLGQAMFQLWSKSVFPNYKKRNLQPLPNWWGILECQESKGSQRTSIIMFLCWFDRRRMSFMRGRLPIHLFRDFCAWAKQVRDSLWFGWGHQAAYSEMSRAIDPICQIAKVIWLLPSIPFINTWTFETGKTFDAYPEALEQGTFGSLAPNHQMFSWIQQSNSRCLKNSRKTRSQAK